MKRIILLAFLFGLLAPFIYIALPLTNQVYAQTCDKSLKKNGGDSCCDNAQCTGTNTTGECKSLGTISTCVKKDPTPACDKTKKLNANDSCCDNAQCTGDNTTGKCLSGTGGKRCQRDSKPTVCHPEKKLKAGEPCNTDCDDECESGKCLGGMRPVCDDVGPKNKPTIPPPPSPPCLQWGVKGTCASVSTAIGGLNTLPTDFIVKIFAILLGVSGGIALLLIMKAGYLLMTSGGNPEGVKAGREQLVAAIVGLIFLIFSFVFLQVIGVDILRLPGWSGDGSTNTGNQLIKWSCGAQNPTTCRQTGGTPGTAIGIPGAPGPGQVNCCYK